MKLFPNNRLREARDYVGLWLSEAAECAGMDPHFLEGIERGEIQIDPEKLERLARLYQRPVAWLTGERAAVDPAEIDPAILGVTSGLSNRDAAELVLFAEFLQHRAEVRGG